MMLSVCLLLCAVISLTGATSDPGPCWDPKEVGPCKASFRRWHFNADSLQCEQFIYGGCQANRNNFRSRQACAKECAHFSTRPAAVPDRCVERMNPGPCLAAFQRWYFNAGSKTCQMFLWGGCKPNGNNFLSKEQCDKTCSMPTS